MKLLDKIWFGRTRNRDTLSHVHNIGTPLVEYYEHLLPVAMVLLGLLCRINKLLHCGQGAGICIGCEYQVLIG